jgi:glycosyltransferase involved in cell wall biosynthesis
MYMLHTVSVVIPTLNEASTVPYLLEDLGKQTLLPLEILLLDSGSADGTAEVVRTRFPSVRVLLHDKQPAHKRNMGGYLAQGEYIVFLDADTRLRPNFLQRVIGEMQRRRIDVACPWYVPHRSTIAIHSVYALFNSFFYLLQKFLASGAGSCIVVRRAVFHKSRGFDTSLKFDDIELIRRLSWRHSFGILHTKVYVSDRRFRQHGTARMLGMYLVLSVLFTLHQFRLANFITYEFGHYKRQKAGGD